MHALAILSKIKKGIVNMLRRKKRPRSPRRTDKLTIDQRRSLAAGRDPRQASFDFLGE